MKTVDTLVIGGGIAGLSAAVRFAAHGSTIVIEAEPAIGVHSSGRSATFSHFGIGGGLVRALTAISRPHLVEAGVARIHPALFLAREDEMAQLAALEEASASLGHGERVAGADLTGIVPVLKGFAAGLLDREGLKLDSDAMLQTHVRTLKAAGGELVLDAPANAIRREGERWIVETPGESYSARFVVNSAGAWADRIAELAGVKPIGLRPLRRTIIAFKPPEEVGDVSAWPFTKTVGEGFYMLPEGRGRLLASPMDEVPSEPVDAQPEEYDIALAAWRVEEGTTMPVRHIEHKWAGLRSFAPDNLPVAGFAPDAPGFFWLAGQGGFGLQTSPAMAMVAEVLLFGLKWPEELIAQRVEPEAFAPDRLI